ncbi:sucrase ferredoxin [Herbiconiux sp. P17]|uniref:sucrase ferredoxin n=1 Tax=Herbiconiux wuyangfengii TaxID=3342794 RepID=UPI0035BB549C
MSGAGATALAAMGWAPCSDRSRERDDPLAATGSRGLQWFLVEVSGAWGTRAFLDPPFDEELGRALVTRIEAAGMRPLAIRRTGRRPPQDSWKWAVVDSRPGQESVRWGEVTDQRELLDVPLDGSTGVASDRPVFAVCAHARHDQCCAVRGRQVVTRLAEAFPEETWECSHLGGDRFAGTMVLLPHGLYYGRVDDGDAAGIAESYLDGRVQEKFFRGRSSLTHPVQAAQHYARLEFGDDRIDAYAPLEESWHDSGTWTVVLRDSDPDTDTDTDNPDTDAASRSNNSTSASTRTITVELAEALSEPLLSTCAATRLGQVRQWRLASITR